MIQGVDWKEVGKYLVVLCEIEEISELEDVLPYRAKGPKKLELSYLDKDLDTEKEEKWSWRRDLTSHPPSGDQKRMMLAKVVKELTTFVMGNHIYRFQGKMRRQITGCGIGHMLSEKMGGIVMEAWSKDFKEKYENNRI